MSLPFPGPTEPRSSRSDVLLGYLDYFRSVVVDKLHGLSDDDLSLSRLPSGWTPLELLKHLIFVERRWVVWGFDGQAVADPWGDAQDGRWYVDADEGLPALIRAWQIQADLTRSVVASHDLSDVGEPGERWDGAPPATLERVLLHLLQEYARHAGHLDVVRELADGTVGE